MSLFYIVFLWSRDLSLATFFSISLALAINEAACDRSFSAASFNSRYSRRNSSDVGSWGIGQSVRGSGGLVGGREGPKVE